MTSAALNPVFPANAVSDRALESVGIVEGRIERWLVSLLDGKTANAPASRTTSEVIEALGQFTWRKQGAEERDGRPVEMAKGNARAERARLKVTRHAKGIAIVRLLVTSVLRESELEELAEALDCLVLSGVRRVLIDFGPVEKMSSQVVAQLAAIQRQCLEAGDGRLAVCGVRPALVELFEITGLSKTIPMYADERAAMETPWPASDGPAPLPVALWQELRRRAAGKELAGPPPESSVRNQEVDAGAVSVRATDTQAWLVVLSGPRSGRGRTVRIGDEPLVIGRDEDCAVRSSYPGLSRRHAQFERRDGQIVVRDLGSTNGTIVKGRVLKGEAAVLKDRARIAIGPLRFAVVIGRPASHALRDDTIVDWLRDPDEATPEHEDGDTRLDLPRFGGDESATFETLRTMVIDDVLVVSPRKARLEGETLIEDLRRDLNALAALGSPRRVVLNLVSVDQIATPAVGLLLAHALGLERSGGSLRLCQVNPRVLAVLERIKVPQILETYNTLDDAVLTKWPE